MMKRWNGTIIGPGHVRCYSVRFMGCLLDLQTVHENRIYSLEIFCDDNYPDEPPAVKFLSRVNLPFVSQITGEIDRTKLMVLAHWNNTKSMETILVEIRRSATPTSIPRSTNANTTKPREMANPHNKKLPQPPEGTTF
jgi:ubiquitin-conjugating enzyme E2 variant